ncbi:hypothetical protein BKA61DRAFT_566487 [Leptodontidium sp. MPI-SDFR-AT-0119]|nr:hypothetical protein BKA61DRAFT_566487 [Leptodontidium sp. MPI-SDFR-AT-0119]
MRLKVFWYFYSQVEFVLVLGSVRIQIFQKFATRLQTSCLHSFEESSTQDAEESKAHDGPERTCSQERAATQFSAQLKSCASLPACNQAATRSSFSNYLGVQDLPLLGDPFAAKNGTWVVKEISQRKNASRIHQIAAAPTSRVVRAPTSPARSSLAQRKTDEPDQLLEGECLTGSGNGLGDCSFFDEFGDCETTQCDTACTRNGNICLYILANGVTSCY